MIRKNELVTFRLVPDRTIDNRRNHDFMRAVHQFTKSMKKRIDLSEKKIQEKERLYWDIVIEKENISFYCTVPTQKGSFIKQQLSHCWERASVNEETFPLDQLDAVTEMNLSRHNIFSLKVDRRVEHEPLSSLLLVQKELQEGDAAVIQIMIEPVSRLSWQDTTAKHHKTFASGKTPRRMRIRKKDAIVGAGDAFCYVMDHVAEAMDIVVDSVSGKADQKDLELRNKHRSNPDHEKRLLMIEGALSAMTMKKKVLPTFKTWVRLGIKADPERRESCLHTMANAFHDLSADNELEVIDLSDKRAKKIGEEMIHHAPSAQTLLDPDAMILSNMELSRLIEMPGPYLQDGYAFESINKREVKIPDALKRGIHWGEVCLKGESQSVCLPTSNYGLLCRPQVIIGKMGTGKTTLGSRVGALFPSSGFSAILLDTADGGLIDAARDMLPEDFPDDHIIDLDFGNLARCIPSDWTEITQHLSQSGEDWDEVEINRRRAGNTLTNILVSFIDKLATHETTDRMERYLSAVSRAILTSPHRGILEIILCLTNDEYREKVLKTFKISDPIVYGTIQELHDMTRESRSQIVKSIMTRMNVLLSHDSMRNSILQSTKFDTKGQNLINMRKWIDGDITTNPKYGGAYFVGIRMPKSELMESACDRLATFWDAKIWLSALSRYDLPVKNGCHGKPFVYIRDEPHQTPSSFQIHDDACREARKWGMKNIWLAHKLEDFDFMRKTLQDAGAQYTMFSTSKSTVRSLKEEFHPFEEEELLQLPEQFWSVNKFANWDQAFLAKMPGTIFVKDRNYRRKECSIKYGTPFREVEKEIFDKTKILYSKEKKK